MDKHPTLYLLRMDRDEDNKGNPCLEIFVFDKDDTPEDAIQHVENYSFYKENKPGTYLLLSRGGLYIAHKIIEQALRDLEAPGNDDTIN